MTTGRINQVAALRNCAVASTASYPSDKSEEFVRLLCREVTTAARLSSVESSCFDALLSFLPALDQRFGMHQQYVTPGKSDLTLLFPVRL